MGGEGYWFFLNFKVINLYNKYLLNVLYLGIVCDVVIDEIDGFFRSGRDFEYRVK